MSDAKRGAIGCAVIGVLSAVTLAMCSPIEPPAEPSVEAPVALPTHKPNVAPADRFAIAAPAFDACPPDDGFCAASRKTVPMQWDRAFRGDYQSQRNIAFIMSSGEFSPPVAVRMPVQGCAWRLVIIETQIDHLTELDEKSMSQECSKLVAADREAATVVAAKIMRRIQQRSGPPAS